MRKNKPKNAPASRPEPVSTGPASRISRPCHGAGKGPGANSGTVAAPRPALVPLLAELISRGDGTFVLRPRLPSEDLDTWITIQQAGEIIGSVNAKTVYGLLGEFLVYRKPLRRKILVSLRSALALKQATQDAEFWDNRELQQRLKEKVRKVMDRLTDTSTQELA